MCNVAFGRAGKLYPFMSWNITFLLQVERVLLVEER